MKNKLTVLLGVAAAFSVGRPMAALGQKAGSARHVTTPSDSSPTTALARAAIKKFFPQVLTDTADPGTLFVILSADGKLLNAAHGSLEASDSLKAKYEDFEGKVQSMEIQEVPAGALFRRALQVVITHFRS